VSLDRPPAALVAEGRRLALRFECARCHEIDGIAPPASSQDCLGCHRSIHAGTFRADRADLDRWRTNLVDLIDTPSLRALGTRIGRAWIEDFLQHPHDLRPHLRATMPRLAINSTEARALVAFLTDVAEAPSPTPRPLDRARIAEGRSLFRARGCPTCHVFRDAAGPVDTALATDVSRLAPDLAITRVRFRPERLAAWIRDPARIKPDTPMPRPAVTDDEAHALASYVWFAPLALVPVQSPPPMLPPLPRRVTWAEVETEVFHRTCRHCHADASLAFGDGGPGNTGGFGFEPRRLELATYPGTLSGLVHAGERRSAFAVDASGLPRLVHALRARQMEEVGVIDPDIRGMPLGHPAVTAAQLQLVVSWIASGRPAE